jgi:glyoxalase/bleomycin resistance protein/dioxygenase superfamily protein
MNRYGLEFHHFGLAVKFPEAAFRYLDDLGYRAGSACYDPLQKVNLAMRHHERMPDVEVIWPGAEPSPIDLMLKQGDGLIYHICYTSKDVEWSLAALEQAGLEILPLGLPKPARLFDGLEVSFHRISGVGVIEIIAGVPARTRP